jgi:predicted permease
MMTRSFFLAQSLNEFVPAESIFTARLHLPEGKGDRYEEGAARIQFHHEVLERLSALPGVTEVASASHFPQSGTNDRPIEIEGVPAENPEQLPRAGFIIQTPRYQSLIGLPILLGRAFDMTDGLTGKEAAIVTRKFANTHWPEELAVGKRFRAMNNKEPGVWMTVVGVCADIEQSPQNPDAPPTVFITMNQEPWGWMGLMVRANGDAAPLAGQVRSAVQAVDSNLPLFDVQTLALGFERQFWFLTVFGTVFFIFALIGLLMASVGIYAVVAQATVRRTREIGIRMALGATASGIRRLVLSRGLRQLAIGLSLGLLGAWGASHVLSKTGILLGVSPNDPVVFVSITVLLASIALFACWLPARRAARVSPTVALRHE